MKFNEHGDFVYELTDKVTCPCWDNEKDQFSIIAFLPTDQVVIYGFNEEADNFQVTLIHDLDEIHPVLNSVYDNPKVLDEI